MEATHTHTDTHIHMYIYTRTYARYWFHKTGVTNHHTLGGLKTTEINFLTVSEINLKM